MKINNMDDVISQGIKTQIELNKLQGKTIDFLEKRIVQLNERIDSQTRFINGLCNELNQIRGMVAK